MLNEPPPPPVSSIICPAESTHTGLSHTPDKSVIRSVLPGWTTRDAPETETSPSSTDKVVRLFVTFIYVLVTFI